jgi:EAL domain-containing protein (putative c-di-GMP-specific phosphodiesterase class I)
VVSLATGEIEEFEALVRWRHPTRGTLAPADFLPVAEDNGAITDIDRWVLGEAVRQLGAWRREQPDASARISVNVSARRFVQGDLATQLRRMVAEEGLSPGALALEVREEVLANPAGWGTSLGADLLGLGVLLQVDNFGTGASSLRDLGRLPVHALKIDRSLVSDVETHPELMRAAVNLAHGLELQVVAEGVETAGQLDRMREMACDSAQGFLFCGPVDGAAAGSLLRTGLRADDGPRGADAGARFA